MDVLTFFNGLLNNFADVRSDKAVIKDFFFDPLLFFAVLSIYDMRTLFAV